MNYKDLISNELYLIKTDLIKLYDAKGMRASGKFAESLEVIETEKGAELWGANYAEQLEKGRVNNNGSSGEKWEDAVSTIEQWIKDKNIQFENITISSLAYLIVRKISREGWNRQGYGGVELISEVITPQRIQNIINKVGDLEVKGFIEFINIELKQFV